MRSPCSALLLVLLALAACGSDQDATCSKSYLTYDNFGQAYMESWCNGCHSATLPPDMRQGAPVGMYFDTLDEIHAQQDGIVTTNARATMPPSGGPTDAERAMLSEWLTCGAR